MTFRQRVKYGAVIAATTVATSAMAAGDPIDEIFAAVNLSTTSASVIALGIVVIGIALAYKGIDLVKRAIRKA